MLRAEHAQALAHAGLRQCRRNLVWTNSLLPSTFSILDVNARRHQESSMKAVGFTGHVTKIRHWRAIPGCNSLMTSSWSIKRPALSLPLFVNGECNEHLSKNSLVFRDSLTYPLAIHGYVPRTDATRLRVFLCGLQSRVSSRANATNRRAGNSKSREVDKEDNEDEEEEEDSAPKGPTKTVKIFCAKCQALIYR